MSANSAYDLELDARLHDAYDAMGPDAATQERVLLSLRAAEQRASGSRGRASSSRRVSWWQVALPLAACLVLAIVVARVGMPAGSAKSDAVLEATERPNASSTAASDEAAADGALAFEAEEGETAPPEDAYSEAAPEPGAEATPGEYPFVTLAAGDTLEVGEAYEGSVDESLARVASAYSADGAAQVTCEVVRENDEYYIRYEGAATWYVAHPLESSN